MNSKRLMYLSIIMLSTLVSSLCFLRYGLSVTMLQGVFLFFVLLYASISDIKTHEVADHVWVTIFALSLVSIMSQGVTTMLLGAICVFVPQLIISLFPPYLALGGADIKISVATAFLLGFTRGIGAFLIGLILAVIFMSIYNAVKKQSSGKPFALVPFLSVGAMLMFII